MQRKTSSGGQGGVRPHARAARASPAPGGLQPHARAARDPGPRHFACMEKHFSSNINQNCIWLTFDIKHQPKL